MANAVHRGRRLNRKAGSAVGSVPSLHENKNEDPERMKLDSFFFARFPRIEFRFPCDHEYLLSSN